MGPMVVRKDVFENVGGFNETYSPLGTPGIGFDAEFSGRVVLAGHHVVQACASPLTQWRNGCGGSATTWCRSRALLRQSQLTRNLALYRATIGAHQHELTRRLVDARNELFSNTTLLAALRTLWPDCVANCSNGRQDPRVSSLWPREDDSICRQSQERSLLRTECPT